MQWDYVYQSVFCMMLSILLDDMTSLMGVS